MNQREAKRLGKEHGYNGATWIDVPEIGTTVWTDGMGRVTVDEDNMWDIMQDICFDSHMNSRDFSPWEHTAHAINTSRNPEETWNAYDDGVNMGIHKRIREARKAWK